jgi:hypothetical protein
MGELLLGCSGWNYPDTADKGGWTGDSILTRTPKGFAITLNSLIQQRWTLLFTKNSIHI